jgi:hypothetical protein
MTGFLLAAFVVLGLAAFTTLCLYIAFGQTPWPWWEN